MRQVIKKSWYYPSVMSSFEVFKCFFKLSSTYVENCCDNTNLFIYLFTTNKNGYFEVTLQSEKAII